MLLINHGPLILLKAGDISSGVFLALLDIMGVNTYIMYLDQCRQGPNLVRY
jgi:hypothetical protein